MLIFYWGEKCEKIRDYTMYFCDRRKLCRCIGLGVVKNGKTVSSRIRNTELKTVLLLQSF